LRGLTTDTSVLSCFAVEQALVAMKESGSLLGNSIRRVAIVGPGLDIIDKEAAFDAYPPQTFQAFALVDSLNRLGLNDPGGLQVTTFDVNARVNEHLNAAKRRAQTGGTYGLTIVRDRDDSWSEPFLKFWERLGDAIRVEASDTAPSEQGNLLVRTIQVQPAVVTATTALDLNIVVQRF